MRSVVFRKYGLGWRVALYEDDTEIGVLSFLDPSPSAVGDFLSQVSGEIFVADESEKPPWVW